MDEPTLRRRHFLVTMWLEPREIEGEAPFWRGSVREISPDGASGAGLRPVHFESWEELPDALACLIRRRAGKRRA
ncbi:hypothetical protein [Ferruginivarius sediminum]|uniref:Uncharacterized protein n=1 Tax=Ferruginivarius sediminum TaxID=2661937 RepID=A0A369T6Q8_9PROT|nr:hypothetical protein [Ferruginivarius sediminum]RDD61011.1 hypothetical protein DRB17_14895 [Ferruginivarius sediminum]